MSQAKASLKSELLRIIKFSLVGGANTALDYLVFLACFYWLSFPILLANFFAFCVAVCLSFYLNSRFTFADMSSGGNAGKLAKFFLVACTAFVAATVAVVYLSAFMPVYLAKIASIVVSLALNYGLSRLLVFKST
ncbi:GtrA family protein [Pseudoteredinibacter isoporae]|nr:GtrA family protein [Pseudoteredinibacter isoporae]NIB23084.1 GtrA family protein [Pseudoteredinibacter isoporae]